MEYINRSILTDGRISEAVTFSDSKKKISRVYHPSGTLVSEVEFASETERTHIEYYPSGAVKAQTHYCRNLYHGEVLRLGRDGRVLHKSTLTYGTGVVRDFDDEEMIKMEYEGKYGGEFYMLRIYLPGGRYRTQYWNNERRITHKVYETA